MTCERAREWMPAYLDGELEVTGSLEFEKHMEECGRCAGAHRDQEALRAAIAGASLYHSLPPKLEARVEGGLRKAAEGVDLKRALLFGGGIAAVLLAGFFLYELVASGGRPGAALAQEIADSHVRSMLSGRLVDVPSTDQHTVKPWFNGRLSYSPPVFDFSQQGFPLAGARLDSVEGRTVAVLVYHRARHVINFYVWPEAPATDGRAAEVGVQGYNLIHWTSPGLNCWLVSDVNWADLENFQRLLKAALADAGAR